MVFNATFKLSTILLLYRGSYLIYLSVHYNLEFFCKKLSKGFENLYSFVSLYIYDGYVCFRYKYNKAKIFLIHVLNFVSCYVSKIYF